MTGILKQFVPLPNSIHFLYSINILILDVARSFIYVRNSRKMIKSEKKDETGYNKSKSQQFLSENSTQLFEKAYSEIYSYY